MKTLYRFALLLAFGLTVIGCKKAAYLTDDGLHTAEVNLSTYDYLAAHPNGMFDTLLLVRKPFGRLRTIRSTVIINRRRTR
jgi:hypothetical protein